MDPMEEPADQAQNESLLEGLAEAWEADPDIRRQSLESASLLKWPDQVQTGQANFRNMRINARVLMPFPEQPSQDRWS